MIKPCAPVDMKIIESAPSLAGLISGDDLTWPSSYRRHSFFTNDRNQTCLSVVPVFNQPPEPCMISCDKFMSNLAQEIQFHFNFLEIQILLKLRLLDPKGLERMMIVGTGGFDRLCKAEKSFCLQLEASLKGGGKLKWVPLDEVQASITGQHSFASCTMHLG